MWCSNVSFLPLQVDLPQGLCVVGDAATCFNPIYGQGMTVGIKGAILLRDTLQQRLQGRKFSSQAATSVLSGFSRVRSPHAVLSAPPWQLPFYSSIADDRLGRPSDAEGAAQCLCLWVGQSAFRAKGVRLRATPSRCFQLVPCGQTELLKLQDLPWTVATGNESGGPERRTDFC